MDLWSKAEQGLSAPLVANEGPGAAGGPAGGGDVRKMLAELQSVVRQLKAQDAEARAGHVTSGSRGRQSRRAEKRGPSAADLEAAYVLVSSIQACLRPPAAATMTRNEQRDLRAAVAALEALRRAADDDDAMKNGRARAADDEKEDATASSSSSRRSDAPLEMELRQQQQQLREEETDSFERMMEEERQRDIEQISERVSTVNQIYRDIAELVSTQQEDVDSIEAQIDTAHTRTTKAQTQLEKANRKRKAKVKCCFYFAVVLACVGVILIVAIIGFKAVAKVAA